MRKIYHQVIVPGRKKSCVLNNFFVVACFLFTASFATAQAPFINTCNFLNRVGGATSTNGAEIPAFDPGSKRVFVVAGPVVEYHLLSKDGGLAIGGSLPTAFALNPGDVAIPNSVAVHNGILAVSYAVVTTATNAQQKGRVSFFNASTGQPLHTIEVGYLPDMIVFTKDGKQVLTANEGEPNSYNQPTSFDPEGSVSIIDISAGITAATVKTASFEAFNAQAAALKESGVRIFGPNATVAQDLEPEYIALSPDGSQAWVTLQENNAIAIIDIASATVLSINPLGLKDHSKPTVTNLATYPFTTMPVLGTTAAGQTVPLGGFSGLTFEGYAPNGNLKFITHTDRGPNGEPTGNIRPFLLPDFAPEIIRFQLNKLTGQITITERIQLRTKNGELLTGLPNTAISASNANLPYNDEVPVDLQGNVITPLDPLGADLEGIVVATDGTFWMVDEYRPAIYHFTTAGVLIDRFVPAGTAAAAGLPAGSFGTETLPAVLAQRRQNRGFEAIAFQDGKIYAFVQSPIRNPVSLGNAVLNGLKNTRIIEFDPLTGTTTRQFIYVMDNLPAAAGSLTDTRADKIGDAVAIGNGQFLVLERDDDAIDSDVATQIEKKIYRFSLAGATDISLLPNVVDGKTLDQMTIAELKAAGVQAITKYLHVDLPAAGFNTVEKVEGLTMVDSVTLAVINDNDFTVAGITIDPVTGTFTPDPNAEMPVLGLLKLRNNGLDASDRDLTSNSGKINIQHWPVHGMYLPDAIASYVVGGETFYITANEGDAREYPGFAEELRVGAAGYVLDPVAFPNATTLKMAANVGRLQLTSASGDVDGDGDFDKIQSLGTRSFSIWNAAGKLVYDSGDELEQITATQSPGLFNSDGTAATFDTRSDNKGPEPEGVSIGIISGVPYAFIGMERVGDIMVYNVSDPHKPVFVQYINTPEDLGVEGLTFVNADQSPTGKPLLIATAEVSKTISIYEVAIPTITATETAGLVNNDGTICSGSEVVLTAAGNGPFTWNTGATTASIKVQPTTTTEYSVTVCNLTATQVITVKPSPTCSIRVLPENNVYTGGIATTIYLGYGAQKLWLNAVPEKEGTYTYAWTGEGLSNLTAAQPAFSTTNPGVYTLGVTVTNEFGCATSCKVVITVIDIRVPGATDKVYLCHNGQPLSISVNSVKGHLGQHAGDRLGTCNALPLTSRPAKTVDADWDAEIITNPAPGYFTLNITGHRSEKVYLRVLDMSGKLLSRIEPGAVARVEFGHRLSPGMYLVEVSQGAQRKTLKVIKY